MTKLCLNLLSQSTRTTPCYLNKQNAKRKFCSWIHGFLQLHQPRPIIVHVFQCQIHRTKTSVFETLGRYILRQIFPLLCLIFLKAYAEQHVHRLSRARDGTNIKLVANKIFFGINPPAVPLEDFIAIRLRKYLPN